MRLIYLTLLIIFPSIIFAQSNYHEGYVLKNNGDTLKGYIDYREWTISPKSIYFKVNKEDKQRLQFDPTTIKGFQINGMETYVAYIGMISTNKTNLSDMPEKPDTTKKSDTTFLRQIVTGKHLTLFYHSDNIKTRFFVAETNNTPVELKYYEYYNENRQIVSLTIYKGQLLIYINKYLLGDTRLNSKIERARYDQPSLEPIVNKINNNSEVSTNKKRSTRIFAGIAANRTITDVYNLNYSGIEQYSTKLSPKISFGVDMFDNPNVQRFVFRAEASISYITPRFYGPAGSSNPSEEYSFNQYTASVTPQILVNVYNKDNFKIFIGGGGSLNYSIYTDDKLINPHNNNIEKPYQLEPIWFNFPLEVGVTLNKKIEICFTRIGYSSYSTYVGFYVSNQSYNLGMKFRLGKN